MNTIQIPLQNIRRLKSYEVLMSPKKVIQRMENIFQKYGRDRGVKSVRFQKAREAWVASVFMLGMSQLTKNIYWIQENEVLHDDPDIFAYSYREPNKPKEFGLVKEIQPIEVCDYPPQVKIGLIAHIKRKLKNKQYHPETILICYIRRPGEAMKLIDVINGLSDLRTSVREVWLLFTVDGFPPSNFTIARVFLRGKKYPEMLLSSKGDYLELCRIPQPEFLRDKRGVQKTIRWKKSGELIVIPLPNDIIKKTVGLA